jgi:plastin-1
VVRRRVAGSSGGGETSDATPKRVVRIVKRVSSVRPKDAAEATARARAGQSEGASEPTATRRTVRIVRAKASGANAKAGGGGASAVLKRGLSPKRVVKGDPKARVARAAKNEDLLSPRRSIIDPAVRPGRPVLESRPSKSAFRSPMTSPQLSRRVSFSEDPPEEIADDADGADKSPLRPRRARNQARGSTTGTALLNKFGPTAISRDKRKEAASTLETFLQNRPAKKELEGTILQNPSERKQTANHLEQFLGSRASKQSLMEKGVLSQNPSERKQAENNLEAFLGSRASKQTLIDKGVLSDDPMVYEVGSAIAAAENPRKVRRSTSRTQNPGMRSSAKDLLADIMPASGAGRGKRAPRRSTSGDIGSRVRPKSVGAGQTKGIGKIKSQSGGQADSIRNVTGHLYAFDIVVIGDQLWSGARQTIRVYDSLTGDLRRTISVSVNCLCGVTLPESETCWVGGSDKKIRLFRNSDGRLIKETAQHGAAVKCMAHYDSFVMSGAANGTIGVWAAGDGKKLKMFHAHSRPVNAVLVVDGMLWTASDDRTIHVTEIGGDWACLRKLKGHTDYVKGLAAVESADTVWSASEDSSVVVWDNATGKFQTRHSHKRGVKAVTSVGDYVLSGTAAGEIRLFNGATGKQIKLLIQPEDHPYSVVSFATADGLVWCAYTDQTVLIWDPEKDQIINAFKLSDVKRAKQRTRPLRDQRTEVGRDRGNQVKRRPAREASFGRKPKSKPAVEANFSDSDSDSGRRRKRGDEDASRRKGGRDSGDDSDASSNRRGGTDSSSDGKKGFGDASDSDSSQRGPKDMGDVSDSDSHGFGPGGNDDASDSDTGNGRFRGGQASDSDTAGGRGSDSDNVGGRASDSDTQGDGEGLLGGDLNALPRLHPIPEARNTSDGDDVGLNFLPPIDSGTEDGGENAAENEDPLDDNTRDLFDYLNSRYGDDLDLKPDGDVPLNKMDDLYRASDHGLLLSKLVNDGVPDTIDTRVLSAARPIGPNEAEDNLRLVVNAAKATGIDTDVTAKDFQQKQEDKVVPFVWDLVEHSVFGDVKHGDHPEFFKDVVDMDRETALQVYEPEELLLKWVNNHLKNGGHDPINNFTSDVADAKAYTVLLNQLDKANSLNGLKLREDGDRITDMLGNAKNMDCGTWLKPEDVAEGKHFHNLGFVSELFKWEEGQRKKQQRLKQQREGIEGGANMRVRGASAEHESIKAWLNSYNIDPRVNSVTQDLQDGLILLRVIDQIEPGIVEWRRVHRDPNNPFKRVENCNYAVSLIQKMGIPLKGIVGEDIVRGGAKFTISLCWQLKAHAMYLFLESLGLGKRQTCERSLRDWANGRVAAALSENTRAKNVEAWSKISGFGDHKLNTGVFLLHLLGSVRKGCVNFDLVHWPEVDSRTNLSGLPQDLASQNAKYVISTAWKIGIPTFMMWEDIVESSPRSLSYLTAEMYVAFSRETRAKELFDQFDVDNNGVLTYDEVLKAFRKMEETGRKNQRSLPRTVSELVADSELLKYIDPDENGVVTYQEFYSAHALWFSSFSSSS